MSTPRLLIHAPTANSLKRGQANLRNLLKQMPDVEVELVVNGPAAADAVTISDADILAHLVLCGNSLNKQGLQAQPGGRVVPAAIGYLLERQQAGWSYVRA